MENFQALGWLQAWPTWENIHVSVNMHAWSSSYRTDMPRVVHSPHCILQSKHLCSGTINFLGLGVSMAFSFETEGSDVVGQFLPRDE